jgi:hypothetical protein
MPDLVIRPAVQDDLEVTATRLTELDLPLDWTDQRSLLAN